MILEIDKHTVKDAADLEEQLAASDDDGALLLVRRGDATVFVPMKPPAAG